MSQTIEAIFDGNVLRPREPYAFFKFAKSLKLKGPPDWSERWEEYRDGKIRFPDETDSEEK